MTRIPYHNVRRKYGNKKVEYRGRKYDSALEANYAMDLDWKKKAGIVKDWKPQHRIDLIVNKEHLCYYIIDFRVEYSDGHIELVECKGMELSDWKLKWKLTHILLDQIEPGAKLVLIKK